MRELNDRDMRILTKGILDTLNGMVNGDERRCAESSQIFELTGLKAYESIVIPHVIQELVHQGLVKECETPSQIRITKKGKDRVGRTIESNIELVVRALVNRPQDTQADGPKIQELTELTPQEINEAVEILEEGGLVKTDKVIGTYPFTFYLAQITARGKYEYFRQSQRQQLSQNTDVKDVSEGKRVPSCCWNSRIPLWIHRHTLGDSYRKEKRSGQVICCLWIRIRVTILHK